MGQKVRREEGEVRREHRLEGGKRPDLILRGGSLSVACNTPGRRHETRRSSRESDSLIPSVSSFVRKQGAERVHQKFTGERKVEGEKLPEQIRANQPESTPAPSK